MALGFGWRPGEVWESYWPPHDGGPGDDAFGEIPPGVLESWRETGDGEPLRQYLKSGKQPTRILFRVLTPDEARMVQAIIADPAAPPFERLIRANLLCFRIAADFPDLKTRLTDQGGGEHERFVLQRGVRMLAPEFVADLDARYPGLSGFFGRRIFDASFPSESEKKASSPPSTIAPSTSDTDRAAAGVGSV